MAKYQVDHVCGCTTEHSLYGKHVEREQKIEWLEEQKCYACVNAEVAVLAKERGLPKLQGSEKQIAWAETLRKEKMEELNKIEEKMEAHKPENEKQEKGKKWGQEAIKRMREETSAPWFIDHRYTPAYYILTEILREKHKEEL